MWGVEIVKDKGARSSFDAKQKVGQELSNWCFKRGLNTRAVGGHTMTFTPALIITDAEIDLGVDIFAETLDEFYAWLKAEKMVG